MMSRLVNATFINGYDGWSFLMLGKVASVIEALSSTSPVVPHGFIQGPRHAKVKFKAAWEA